MLLIRGRGQWDEAVNISRAKKNVLFFFIESVGHLGVSLKVINNNSFV